MRIKIIGDNNCARATRHLLRKAGFAVSEYLPAEVITAAPHSGYAITIELSPAPLPPPAFAPRSGATAGRPSSAPDHSTHDQPASSIGEVSAIALATVDASSPSFAPNSGATAGKPSVVEDFQDDRSFLGRSGILPTGLGTGDDGSEDCRGNARGLQAEACATGSAHIHFDSVDSALEAAILRHVTQLAAGPVVVDRPGGVVHSERELRIIVPLVESARCKAGMVAARDGSRTTDHSEEFVMDEAAAVAVEFGVLRGLLDLASPTANAGMPIRGNAGMFKPAEADKSAIAPRSSGSGGGKKWWMFGLALFSCALLAPVGHVHAAPRSAPVRFTYGVEARGVDGAFLHPEAALAPALLATPAQGQFATGQQTKITDGTNTLVVDPCKAQIKLYASINQTANTQLVAGTASKKIYICSIHVVVAAATNVALVEGTGSVCATGTAGVSGFGGATAATGWSFAVNGGIAFGNGDAALGAEGNSADNLCLFNSGTGQVSGGISYVVQ